MPAPSPHNLILLHVFYQGSYDVGCWLFFWSFPGLFQNPIYSQLWGLVYLDREKAILALLFLRRYLDFFPSCKWVTDSCLPAVDHPFWETGTNTPKGPCCLFSASGKASSSRSRCLYTCEDLLSCCAVNMHMSKTVSMQPLRPRVQRDSYQLLLMGSSHSSSLRLS